MEIRPYKSADREAVIGLFRQFMEEHGFADYVERAIAEELGRIDAYYAGPGQGFWVAEEQGIAGMVGVERESDSIAELRRMVVERSRRRRGIARMLLATAEGFCRRAGYSAIVLSTSELQAPAMRLWESSGYRLLRTEKSEATTHKQVGGLTRQYYQKELT